MRWLLLGLLLYGLGTAFRKGWLEVQWQRLLDDVGLQGIDPEKPIQLQELPMFKAPSSQREGGR